MTLQKNTPVVLMMFAIMCALPVAGVVAVPSAIAEEEEETSLAEALTGDIISNAQNGGGETNQEQLQTVDQTGSNLDLVTTDVEQDADAAAIPLGLQVDEDVFEEEPAITPTPTEEEPPEGESQSSVLMRMQ